MVGLEPGALLQFWRRDSDYLNIKNRSVPGNPPGDSKLWALAGVRRIRPQQCRRHHRAHHHRPVRRVHITGRGRSRSAPHPMARRRPGDLDSRELDGVTVAYDLTGRALYPYSQILQQQEFPARGVHSDRRARSGVRRPLLHRRGGLHHQRRPPPQPSARVRRRAGAQPAGPARHRACRRLRGRGIGTSLLAEFVIGPEPSAALADVPITLRLKSELLKPMKSRTEVDETKSVELTLGTVSLRVSPDGFDANVNVSVSLPMSMIGDTGVLIEAANVRPILGPMNSLPPGVDASFRGVFIESARVYLPEGLPELAPSDLTITNCSIGTGGFSGALAVNYNAVFDAATKTFSGPGSGKLFGIPFAITRVGITLTEHVRRGRHRRLDGPALLRRSPQRRDRSQPERRLLGRHLEPGGLVALTKEDLVELQLESIGFAVEAGVFTVRLSA